MSEHLATRTVYCNNCGNYGHNYQNCKYPITSNGLIVFRCNDGEIQYLMIKRKDSLGFVEFMRGKYPLNNFYQGIDLDQLL